MKSTFTYINDFGNFGREYRIFISDSDMVEVSFTQREREIFDMLSGSEATVAEHILMLALIAKKLEK